MAMEPERSRLHNFNLVPLLKWGNSRLLRCMKENPNLATAAAAAPDRRSSAPAAEKGSATKRHGSGSGSGRRPAGVEEEEGIEAFGAKLMFDLQAEADKLKVAILKEGLTLTTLTPPEADSSRPWNLRTRRAACKAPMEQQQQPPPRNGHNVAGFPPPPPPLRERSKFSVSLSKREIDEDFLSMVSHRPPRRPKKRPKIVQHELDALFPGLWLTEVTADMYKVPDSAQNENGSKR